jgi:hypothetical protein
MKNLLIMLLLSTVSFSAMARSSALRKVELECARPALNFMQERARYYGSRLDSRTLKILTSKTYILDGIHIVLYTANASRGSEKTEFTALARRSIYKNQGDCGLSQ